VRDGDVVDRVVEVLREPVRIDPALDRRVMAQLEELPSPRRVSSLRAVGAWLVRPRAIAVSPLAALGAAAALALAVLAGRAWLVPGLHPPVHAASTAAAARSDSSAIQFVVLAPHATSVALVGDFNDWDAAATPMRRAAGNGVWSVTVPLAPGRYRYSFLLDGSRWEPDPEAPRALDDDFGRPNSVVTVGGT
jgi:hypothetical protein